MAYASFPVVTEYLEPNRPVTFIGLVFPLDTVALEIKLTKKDGAPVDLTGCSAVVVNTDSVKSTVWSADVVDAAGGRLQTVIQPDVVGRNMLVAKVTSEHNDETTFFLGSLSVAADRRGANAAIVSATQGLVEVRNAIAQDLADMRIRHMEDIRKLAEAGIKEALASHEERRLLDARIKESE